MSILAEEFQASRVASRLEGPQPWETYSMIPQEEAIAQAVSQGLSVVLPEPNQLQLDLDSNAEVEHFYSMLGLLHGHFSVIKTEDNPSKSYGLVSKYEQGHRHVTITLDRPISNIERVLLQAVLGSDRKREFLSFIRLLKGEQNPTVFFELTPDEVPF